ncbi:MAG: ATP-binding protein [Zoogloea sp.]|nr:ATP-binding protein [Zoogloea sp.]
MNAPLGLPADLSALQPEWERLQVLAYCLSLSRQGREIPDDEIARLRGLQLEVDALRTPGGTWECLVGQALDPVEWDVLAAVVGPELEPRLGWLYQSLQNPPQVFPSRALIHELLALDALQGHALRAALGPLAALRRHRLVQSPADDGWHALLPEPGLLARLTGRQWDAPAPPGAERVLSRATWDDLVLPADRIAMLREFMLWIEHRTTVEDNWGGQSVGGPVALFGGPSGTGKTMAASVLANALGWPLFRIDLGRLVSKYVGETEENLNRLFDAAHGRPMVLQFDEADALFAKRGEIKEARDRYANMEVSHLLTRIESHRGPCILTTNLRRQMDAAFTRRLQMVVEFPRPDSTARAALWERLLPPRAPRAEALSVTRLADAAALSGGQIRNAALHAAYLAAGADSAIDLPHAALGIWRELTKDGHECSPATLGDLAAHLPEACGHA